jgi:hypothetical protein
VSIASEHMCEGYCCPDCERALRYESEEDWENWWQWCVCSDHGAVDDEDAVMCDAE